MILALFSNEWRSIVRDGRGRLVITLGVLLALVSAWTSASTHASKERAQAAAVESARCAWEDREVDSAHSRAHFGDYVFRPSGSMSTLDSGLQAVTGRVVFTEAHRQNDAVHKPQQAAASLLRYDRLEPSTVLQILAALVLVLAGFGVISSERESGRLNLLLIQGVSSRQLLLAKTLALWTLGVALCLVVVGANLILVDDVDIGRIAAFLGLHLATLWVVAALVACISARAKRTGTAAALLLSLWVAGAIVIPRLSAMSTATLDPLPGRDAFQAAMQADRQQGIDGHNPMDERRNELERKVLKEYGVSSREELPVSLGGLIMQADEEYGAKVWDKHFGELEGHLLRQDASVGKFSFLNPFQATDRLSMAIAGTGLNSHLEFLRQTEYYRRELVQRLNEEDAFGVARSENGRLLRTTTKEFYLSFDSFEYKPLALGEMLGRRTTDLLALALWIFGASALLILTARQMEARRVS